VKCHMFKIPIGGGIVYKYLKLKWLWPHCYLKKYSLCVLRNRAHKCHCVVISNIHIDNLLFYLFSNFTPNIARIEIQALYINSKQRRTEETKIRSLLNLKLAATILANCYVTSCALFRSTTTQTGLVAEWVPFSWC
jgi:hypothetical protein